MSMVSEPAFARKTRPTTTLFTSKCKLNSVSRASTLRASASMDEDDKNKVYKQLGLFALKRKIEDAVIRAEILAPMALEVEEARRNEQEEMIRAFDLWDDLAKSNEIFTNLADSAKAVDSLKDLTYKVEEAKLITQLAEMDAINYGLFKQAYNASLDVSKILDQYEMSKLLKGPYDSEGACVVITAGSEAGSEIWAGQLLKMYTKWAKKHGNKARVVEKRTSLNGGLKFATIEFEFKFAYGYLSGETGVHRMNTVTRDESAHHESSSAVVDVIPVFIEKALDLQIDEEDLVIGSPAVLEEEEPGEFRSSVCIQHVPTGIRAQSTGERRQFANRIKALNRLKAKLLVVALEQGVSCVSDVDRNALVDDWERETRKYIRHPQKLVHDVKSGIQLPVLYSVLDGNLEPFIAAHINTRLSNDKV